MLSHNDSKKRFNRLQRERLGNILKAIRKEKGINQAELAKQLDTTQSVVSKWELGEKVRLELVELWHISKALDIPLLELVRRWEEGV